MPGPGTIFTLGAVGAAGAAAYVRRNSLNQNNEDTLTPIGLARQASSSLPIDHDYQDRKQPEYLWRRNNGVSFSHSSKPKYPTDISMEQSSSK